MREVVDISAGSVYRAAFGFFHDDGYLDDGEKSAKYLNSLDAEGFEVHVFGGLSEKTLLPHMLPGFICDYAGGRLMDAVYVFITDSPELCELAYKTYQNTFFAFILLNRGSAPYKPDDGKYLALLNACMLSNIEYCRPVYLDGDYKGFFSAGILGDLAKPLADFSIEGMNAPHEIEAVKIKKKYFRFGSEFILFEPIAGESEIISVNGGMAFDEQAELSKATPNIMNTTLCCPVNNKPDSYFIELMDSIDKNPDIYFHNGKVIQNNLNHIIKELCEAIDVHRLGYTCYFELLAASYTKYARIYLLSILINNVDDATLKTFYINQLYESVIGNDGISKEEKNYLMWQLKRIVFVNAGVGDGTTVRLSRLFYREIYREFLYAYKDKMKFIPKEERIKNFVLIVTSQILSFEHGPTKTTFDRAYSLKKHMGMDIFIVNIKDVLPWLGHLPLYSAIHGNVVNEYAGMSSFLYNGIEFAFHQINGLMPSDAGISWLIDFVNEKKPYFVLIIGDTSICADLLSNIVPTICQTLGPSGLALTEGQFQVIGRPRTLADTELLESFGLTKEHIIEALFTSNFKPQTTVLSRESLGLPDGKFLIIVVGTRLSEEVTLDFISCLLATVSHNTYIVFAGEFEKYQFYSDTILHFNENSIFLGLQGDMLAVFETCDLYANPKRAGGGTSVAEAMYKGLPAVTLNYGDVAVGTGVDFHVQSYSDMADLIKRYASDKSFYNTMSAKAKERAALLMDTGKNLKHIIDTAISSPLFQ